MFHLVFHSLTVKNRGQYNEKKRFKTYTIIYILWASVLLLFTTVPLVT